MKNTDILDGDHENPKPTKNNKFAIHIPNKKDWPDVVKYLYDHGYRWNATRSGYIEINEYHWNNFKENSCLYINEHKIFFTDYDSCIGEANLELLNIDNFRNRI